MSDLSISLIRNSGKYFELISAIVGTIYFYKYKRTYLKYFLFLLWYITLTEFFSEYAIGHKFLVYIDDNGLIYTHWMYNLLYFILFNVLYVIYLKSIKNSRYKFWIKIFIISYIVISIINWTLIQNFVLEMSVFPYIFGSIFLIITIVFYFIELLNSDKIVVFHRELFFWISIGLLLFHSGTIPFSLEYNGYALIPGIHKLFSIITILSNIMYLIFTFGFIWSRKE
jgi:hypothetical protein